MKMIRRQSGAAALEFAVVLPLLLILVFGIIFFGIAFAQTLALSNGAREAARAAVVPGQDCGEIVELARAGAETIAMDEDDVEVEVALSEGGANICTSDAVVPCSGASPGDRVFVTTTFTTSGAFQVPLTGIGAAQDLTGTGVFRCEFS